MKKTDDILLKRLILSIGILLFIRMGTFLPIPGINHGQLAFYIGTQAWRLRHPHAT